MVFGPDGNLYVTSMGTNQVLRYNGSTGAFIDAFVVARSGGLTLPHGIVFRPPITPQVGLWWNPGESGSGYALDYKHGVLVVTVYSYTPAGGPMWYLASGPVNGNTFISTLDKYQNGQCIFCAYPGRPALVGNDGTITTTFTSPTTATMTLPGQPPLFDRAGRFLTIMDPAVPPSCYMRMCEERSPLTD